MISRVIPISLLIRQESTLGQVLNSMARYIRLHNEALLIRVEIANGIVVIREELIVEQLGSIRQLIELAVGALFRMLRELMGNSWEPQRICFTHGPPASLVSHVRTFGRFVEFGCDFNGLVCSEQDLASNAHLADPVMARYARQYIDQMFERPNMSTGDKVRQLVYTLLPLGHCSVEKVSQHLGMDRRTLHRHLKHDSETFSSVVDAAREKLAVPYVSGGHRKLEDIAALLGFTSRTSFSRWFRTRVGCPVTAWRISSTKSKAATDV